MENNGCSINKTKIINTPKIVYENDVYYHEPYNSYSTNFLNSLTSSSLEKKDLIDTKIQVEKYSLKKNNN
jgi:hypothetical protein